MVDSELKCNRISDLHSADELFHMCTVAPRPAIQAEGAASIDCAAHMNDQPGNDGAKHGTPTIRAAEYARISTEHQQYLSSIRVRPFAAIYLREIHSQAHPVSHLPPHNLFQ